MLSKQNPADIHTNLLINFQRLRITKENFLLSCGATCLVCVTWVVTCNQLPSSLLDTKTFIFVKVSKFKPKKGVRKTVFECVLHHGFGDELLKLFPSCIVLQFYEYSCIHLFNLVAVKLLLLI